MACLEEFNSFTCLGCLLTLLRVVATKIMVSGKLLHSRVRGG